MFSIDLNADIGEGMPYDEDLLKIISSCNIACGGHTGDKSTIQKTIELAKLHNVKIGAHPSYPDKVNFGRKSIVISNEDLLWHINEQLEGFKTTINQLNAKWQHIKFHGALYNDLKYNKELAETTVEYLMRNYPDKILYVPPNSEVLKIAEKKLKTKTEGFADRAYNDDLSLVSRTLPDAVITNEIKIIERVVYMVLNKKIKTKQNRIKEINVETICLHGDTPKALTLAKNLAEALKQKEILIQ